MLRIHQSSFSASVVHDVRADHADVTFVKACHGSDRPTTRGLSLDNLFIHSCARASLDHRRDRSSRILLATALETVAVIWLVSTIMNRRPVIFNRVIENLQTLPFCHLQYMLDQIATIPSITVAFARAAHFAKIIGKILPKPGTAE